MTPTTMKNKRSISRHLVALLPMSLCGAALAQDWTWELSPSVTAGSYQNSDSRQRYLEKGLTLSIHNADQAGIRLGTSSTTIGMHSGYVDIEQSAQTLSGFWRLGSASMNGRWTARLDLHSVRSNDSSSVTDRVSVWAPQLSWVNDDASLYADLGFARSRYLSDLTVNQVTPTVGFAWNERRDWLQLRGYHITGLNSALAAGKSSATALEAKWTHYLAPANTSFWPVSWTLGVTGGERVYAVDMDAQTVSNLSDLHIGSATLGLTWQPAKAVRLFTLLGQQRYRSSLSGTDYQLHVAHATLSWDF